MKSRKTLLTTATLALAFIGIMSVSLIHAQPVLALSSSQIKKDALDACNTKNTNSWCVIGYINGYNGQSSQAVCTQWVGTSNYGPCVRGINLGRAAANNAPTDPPVPTNDPSTPSKDAQSSCAGKTGKAAAACSDGYDGQTSGKSKDAACRRYSGNSLKVCQDAWDQAQGNNGGNGQGVAGQGNKYHSPGCATSTCGHQCGGGSNSYTPSVDIGCKGKGNPIMDALFGIIHFLSLGVGLVVIGSIVVGGIQYTASRGDPQATALAINRIRSSLFALIIYIFAYAALNYIIPAGVLK